MIFPIFLKINIILCLTLRTINGNSIKLFYQPSMYVLNDRLQKEKVTDLIEEYSEDLKNIYGKCMDIGCGPGDITKDILLPALHPNTKVIGTDILQYMVEYAKRTYSIENRLEYEVLDIQTQNLSMKYVSEFDCIVSFHALHWCNDIRQAFKNIHRMLRPNGIMLILFAASHDIFTVLDHVAQDIRFAPYIKDVNKYIWPFQKSIKPRKELKEMLQNIGFKVIHCSHREMFYFDEDPNRFFFSILSFLDFIDDMPCTQKKEFKKEFARQFAETQISHTRKSDNKTVTLNLFKVLIVFAQKYVP